MAVLFIAIPLKAYNKGNRSSLFSSPLSYKVNTTSLGTYDVWRKQWGRHCLAEPWDIHKHSLVAESISSAPSSADVQGDQRLVLRSICFTSLFSLFYHRVRRVEHQSEQRFYQWCPKKYQELPKTDSELFWFSHKPFFVSFSNTISSLQKLESWAKMWQHSSDTSPGLYKFTEGNLSHLPWALMLG